MARKKGICTLCGAGGQLTFEHVPPDASGNVHGVTVHTLEEWLARDSLIGPLPGGYVQPEGLGRFALCDRCNHHLGDNYVPPFIDFVQAGRDLLIQIGAEKCADWDGDTVTHGISAVFKLVDRLRVAKQIVAMMLVTAGRDVVTANPELARFVLDLSLNVLPSKYRLFLALTAGPYARVTGVSGTLDITTHQSVISADIVYPPFAYLLVFNGEIVLPYGEISDWMRAPGGGETDISVQLPFGFSHTAFPTDLRSLAQAERDRAANIAEAAAMPPADREGIGTGTEAK